MSEDEFLRQFETCALPAREWTHCAHVRMAWCYLTRLTFDEAAERIRQGIIRYNTEVLDKLPEYHETVTVAFTRLIHARLDGEANWQEFAGNNPDLFSRTAPVLWTYYSPDCLNSTEARRAFVKPDRQPLPGPVSE